MTTPPLPLTLNLGFRTLPAWLALLAAAPACLAHGDGRAHQAGPPAAAAQAAAPEQQPWGIAGTPSAVRRTVEVRMTDAMRFEPDRIEVRLGETVRFRITNAGQAMHELVLGTKEALDAHAALMLRFPDMEHDEPYMAHVAPGKTGEIVWTFNRPGTFDFACLVAGHYQAGMSGRIAVVAPR